MFHVEPLTMNTLLNCPVCNSTNLRTHIEARDHFLSRENFSISECGECGLMFTNPRPEDADLSRYYQSEDYISHSNTNKGIVSKLYKAVRNLTLSSKEKLVRSFVSRGTLLDYGCGSGHFIAHCQTRDWKVYGVEPDDGARAIAKQTVSTIYKTKEELLAYEKQKQYSAITLWHVLEHLPKLDPVMKFLNDSLEKNGALFIALPNPNSYDARKYKTFWAAYDLPRHLYHFNKASLSKIMAKHGFVFVETKPMYFDSFYVSMLSEKYLHGKTRLISALISGLISNLKAWRSGEYSSLIYIFRKA
jgi:2-polyprenyl-3-methyl-5-hydroxy-6-metoxy-1,4-benzoquinol methylase